METKKQIPANAGSDLSGPTGPGQFLWRKRNALEEARWAGSKIRRRTHAAAFFKAHQRKSLAGRISELESENVVLGAQLDEAEQSLGGARIKIEHLKRKVKELETIAERLDTYGGSCFDVLRGLFDLLEANGFKVQYKAESSNLHVFVTLPNQTGKQFVLQDFSLN